MGGELSLFLGYGAGMCSRHNCTGGFNMGSDSNSFSDLLKPLMDYQRKSAVILFSATLLMLIWAYFGSEAFFRQHLATRFDVEHPASAAANYRFLCGSVLLGLVPMLIVKFGFRERLRDYGVGIGTPRDTLQSILWLVPIFLGVGFLAGSQPGLQDKLLSNPELGKTMPFVPHACIYLLFYLSWEFNFRGFLLRGLAGEMGTTNAILIQVMASSVMHLRDPAPECFGAFAGGVLWGLLALRTNSLLSGMLQHAALGLAVDWTAAYY